MLLSFILILLITVGGLSLTYLFADDEPLLWRVCAGNIVGSALFGLICFLLACFFGFNQATVSLSFLISLSPLVLFNNKANRLKFLANWRKAKGKLEGANSKKIFRFAYYVFFFGLFWLFFERAMLETPNGIFTGGSQNLGDLPFHLGAIFSFTDGQNFPPENPSYAFAKFSYPFMADLVTASFVALGGRVREAMLVQNVFLAFSLLVILERFTFKLTGSWLAGKIAPVLLFFSGGLGFLWFFKDFWQQAQGFFDFVWNLPRDYTSGDKFRWGNSLITLFVTQRSLLLGMPLTIIVLQRLWEVFNRDKGQGTRDELNYKTDTRPSSLATRHCFFLGLLAGTLPLIHVHSLVVLFVVSAFLFFFRSGRWREWIAFGAGVSIVAVPELIWAMTGSATRLTEFVAWNFGWDLRGENFIWFWFKNLGIFIPILIFGIYLVFSLLRRKKENELRIETDKRRFKNDIFHFPFSIFHLYFYLPFLLCFVVANLVKLAPWEWDNIKVLIYWFVGSLPFAAFCLAWLWNKDRIFKIIAVGCLVVLTFSGALDVWRVVAKQINYKVFDKDAVAISQQIKQKTAPNALFLNAPTYNSAIVLSGRRSLMRYSGHLSSYGIDYQERETEVKKIYSGDPAAEILLTKYGIEYVLISPEEKSNLTVNEEFFRRYPVAAEAGQYRVYQVKK
ncbi:MAG: hypothetical protein H0X72_21360 [Acidobacteria bacterium]|jgi:hypothetical protein|nr:hypothetical protein [Acidobacteriota bacterium]